MNGIIQKEFVYVWLHQCYCKYSEFTHFHYVEYHFMTILQFFFILLLMNIVFQFRSSTSNTVMNILIYVSCGVETLIMEMPSLLNYFIIFFKYCKSTSRRVPADFSLPSKFSHLISHSISPLESVTVISKLTAPNLRSKPSHSFIYLFIHLIFTKCWQVASVASPQV